MELFEIIYWKGNVGRKKQDTYKNNELHIYEDITVKVIIKTLQHTPK